MVHSTYTVKNTFKSPIPLNLHDFTIVSLKFLHKFYKTWLERYLSIYEHVRLFQRTPVNSSSHTVAYNPLLLHFQELQCPLLSSVCIALTVYTDIHAADTHTHNGNQVAFP